MILTKKEKTSLKPLSEKEIQRKLYGNILSSTSVEEAPEPRWTEPPKAREIKELKDIKEKERKPVTEKPRISLPQSPKINISIPWKKIGETWSILFKSAFALGKVLFSRMATVWGMGAVIVAVLFISVHSLNSFRTKAMKAPKQEGFASTISARKVRQKTAQTKKQVIKVPEARQPLSLATKDQPTKEIPLPAAAIPPASPAAKEPTPGTPVGAQDPYVIQVCTYASEADANKLIEELKGQQITSFFQSSTRSSGKTFYLVFLGRYKDLREAQARLKEFRSKTISKSFPDSFIRTLS